MKDWTTAEWVAVASLAVAIIGIPITLWGTRRWGERRARLLFTYRSVPLLPEGDKHDLVKVTYRDFEVPNPHLVTLNVANIGPKDIASTAFDQDKPLRINLAATTYGIVSSSSSLERGPLETVAIGTKDGYVSFTPHLLRRRQIWTVGVLVSGEPTPELVSSLIDTDVISAEEGEQVQVGIGLASALVSATVPAVGGGISALLQASGRRGTNY